MASLTEKRNVAPSPKTGRLPHKPLSVSPSRIRRIGIESPLLLKSVERATDLGNGYVIVKIHEASTKHIAKKTLIVKQQVPLVTRKEMAELFSKLNIPVSSPAVEKVPVKQQAKHTIAENESFMKTLASEGMADRQNNLKKGLLLTSGELCDRLQFTRQALSKAVKEFRLFALEGPSGNLLYPAFFTSPVASRRKLEKVSQALGDLPGASKWQFFTTPKASLQGKTPVEALAKGEIDHVLRAAAGFKER